MQAAPYGTSVKGFRDSAGAGTFRLAGGLDLLLLLAAVGLMACSVYTIAGATQNDIPGDPHFFVVRQAAYGAIGLILMLVR